MDEIIEIKDVEMVFNKSSEQYTSLKEYLIAFASGKLKFVPFVALKNINLTINRGDVCGIVGSNGSGKSTLLKLIAGVLEPTKGALRINGTVAPLIELGAGFDLELTARENIYLNGSLIGYSEKFIDKKFDEIIEFAEIKDFIDVPMKNYSSGMIARIAFSIATIGIPDILIVDETLSVGDFKFQQKCEKRIKELVGKYKTTLLFVSHSIEQIRDLCEKVIWIEESEMKMNGGKEVCDSYLQLL